MSEETKSKRYLTEAQVRTRYGEPHRTTLWRWCNDHETAFPAPALRINGRSLWDEADLDRYDASARLNPARKFGEAAR
ncbi:helix-turn-helix transcriptional regulator [Ancylobacter terrae]|uniref:helix-turn-helix transcriptional regulator n=1 Tax=Ancylobacter sp. sgz301288 TaxID=3342077 RepID=UPI003859CE2B